MPFLVVAIFLLCSQRLPANEGVLNPNSHLHDSGSPYLLQHANNPVNWYQWSEEAFERAREEDKPIFLSIGFSTCHWCHVMERESFMDPATAEILNQNFISIKLDREERPDIDRIYLSYVQAATGEAGWPLNVWLTPDLEPFYGGNYFPPESSNGRPAFNEILKQLVDAWNSDSKRIRLNAQSSVRSIINNSALRDSSLGESSTGEIEQAIRMLANSFDSRSGGFGGAPKFPSPTKLHFLHRAAYRQGLDSADGQKTLGMSLKTLREIAKSGIYDHLGGGIHRYSIDANWQVPHFEKMLYDQAQMASAYLEAYELTDDNFYADTAREILDFVLGEMTHHDGGFYSALSAESLVKIDSSESAEGAYYLWSHDEIERLLGENAELFHFIYGVEEGGNVRSDPFASFTQKNILHQRKSLVEAAAEFNRPLELLTETLRDSKRILFYARSQRPKPLVDDKIITAWNGLMISSLARAHHVLGNEAYLDAAQNAASFIQRQLYAAETGLLQRSFRGGPSKVEGFAGDYAFLIQGLLDLYEADLDVNWLLWIEKLQHKQDALFWDSEGGSYYASAKGAPSVILHMKVYDDGAIPSENSVSALNLLRLSAMLNNPELKVKSSQILNDFQQLITETPTSVSQILIALDFSLQKPQQIIIAGRPYAKDTQHCLKMVHKFFLPHAIILGADGADGQDYLAQKASIIGPAKPIEGKATVYICDNYICETPVNEIEELRKLLE